MAAIETELSMATPPPDDSRTGRKPEPPRCPASEEAETDLEAEQAFIESLIATGQAAKPDTDGRLPPGATHELVEEGGRRRVVRRRFSAY
jgi:hypothetical protein